MNEIKTVVNSSLRHMQFTDEMKERVLAEGRKAVENGKSRKQKSFGRYAIPVAACLILCVGTTVAAKALLWDKYVAEKYHVDENEQIQEETVDDGLADKVVAVAEDNGIRIEIMQTVATDNHLDLYFKIQAENEKTAKMIVDTNPDWEILFENAEVMASNGGMENYYTGEGMKTIRDDNKEEGPEYEIYNVECTTSGDSLDGDIVHLKIHNFIGNSQTSPDKVVEGDWELSWNIQASQSSQTFVFDKEYTLYGKTVKVNKVKLNSTGATVYLDKKSIDEQGLMGAELYMVQSPEQAAKNAVGIEYESAEWRGICGIPLELYKNLSEEERNKVFDQVKAGTYQGEYMEYSDWCTDDQHNIVDPWWFEIELADGTKFVPENDTGVTRGTEAEYEMTQNYVGYLNIDEVSAIWFGDCRIPLSDAVRK